VQAVYSQQQGRLRGQEREGEAQVQYMYAILVSLD